METDYKKIGLKAGLEIHQQLATNKLFCNCPSLIRQDAPHFTIKRELRPLAGELGEIDPAAIFERKKKKYFLYEGYNDSICQVELDEEPPKEINKEALEIALSLAKALHCTIPDNLQVMRKTIIDGSNVSGFQRTLLIGLNGWLETSFGKIGLQSVALEEDAARKISETEEATIYRLDRLGIPLIEISTAPDCHTPEQVKEAAEKIGLLLRTTRKVMRGIGTIRQDINISIEGGNRVEIKGVQELQLIPKLVENEIRRQISLLEIKQTLNERKIKKVESEIYDLTHLFKNTQSNILKNQQVFSIILPGFAGLLKGKLGPEFAKYAKYASGVRGLFHSDELPGYGVTQEEVLTVRNYLKLREQDSFILIAASKEIAKRAFEAIIQRANLALQGVPKEVRQALPDGKTEFLRPMPGAARMYPETDLPLIFVNDLLLKIKPIKDPEIIKKELRALGLSEDLVNNLVFSKWLEPFKEFAKKYPKLSPTLIATTMLIIPKEIRRKLQLSEFELDTSTLNKLFISLSGGDKKFPAIVKESLSEIIETIAKEKPKSLADLNTIIKRYSLLSDVELKKEIIKLKKEFQGPSEKFVNYALSTLRGKASAKKIIQTIKSLERTN
ncbi:MAG: Glu-tRNA(Gln) amidotransferase subunit GatE [Candidatus Nanoarchaeia archaeon]